MLSPSPMHLLVLGLVILLVLGPRRLPEIARTLGSGLRELKGSLGDDPLEPPAAALAPPSAADARDDVRVSA